VSISQFCITSKLISRKDRAPICSRLNRALEVLSPYLSLSSVNVWIVHSLVQKRKFLWGSSVSNLMTIIRSQWCNNNSGFLSRWDDSL